MNTAVPCSTASRPGRINLLSYAWYFEVLNFKIVFPSTACKSGESTYYVLEPSQETASKHWSLPSVRGRANGWGWGFESGTDLDKTHWVYALGNPMWACGNSPYYSHIMCRKLCFDAVRDTTAVAVVFRCWECIASVLNRAGVVEWQVRISEDNSKQGHGRALRVREKPGRDLGQYQKTIKRRQVDSRKHEHSRQNKRRVTLSSKQTISIIQGMVCIIHVLWVTKYTASSSSQTAVLREATCLLALWFPCASPSAACGLWGAAAAGVVFSSIIILCILIRPKKSFGTKHPPATNVLLDTFAIKNWKTSAVSF